MTMQAEQAEISGTLTASVPTYNGNAYPEKVETGELPDFGKPFVPVVVTIGTSVDVLLDTRDPSATHTPCIRIERRPEGWTIFLQPVGGGDESGYVYFNDDGTSYVAPETGIGPTPAIKFLPVQAAPPPNGETSVD